MSKPDHERAYRYALELRGGEETGELGNLADAYTEAVEELQKSDDQMAELVARLKKIGASIDPLQYVGLRKKRRRKP